MPPPTHTSNHDNCCILHISMNAVRIVVMGKLGKEYWTELVLHVSTQSCCWSAIGPVVCCIDVHVGNVCTDGLHVLTMDQ